MLPEESDWLIWYAGLDAYDLQAFFVFAFASETL